MNTELRDIQLAELEILKVFRDICVRHDISYSLHGGTLLGAVRHKGFIPWDDDVDVFMERLEFDRFVEAWNADMPEGYFLQTKDTEQAYTRSFAKIRKENTTFLQGIEDPTKIHTGIFIDVMAFDRIPDKAIDKARFYWAGIRYEVLCRGFVPARMNIAIRTMIRLILMFNPEHKREQKRKKLLKTVTKFNGDRSLELTFVETIGSLKRRLPPELFDKFIFMEFEGEEFMCTKVWDKFLKIWFGDYMTLPPEEKRVWIHSPVMIDLEHSFADSKTNK